MSFHGCNSHILGEYGQPCKYIYRHSANREVTIMNFLLHAVSLVRSWYIHAENTSAHWIFRSTPLKSVTELECLHYHIPTDPQGFFYKQQLRYSWQNKPKVSKDLADRELPFNLKQIWRYLHRVPVFCKSFKMLD